MNLLSKASRVFTIVHSRSFRSRAFDTIGSRRYVSTEWRNWTINGSIFSEEQHTHRINVFHSYNAKYYHNLSSKLHYLILYVSPAYFCNIRVQFRRPVERRRRIILRQAVWGGVTWEREGSELPLWAKQPHDGAGVDYRKDQTLSYILRVWLDIKNMWIIIHCHNCPFMV